MSIQKTLAGLAKNNNGFFKSEKQANYLLKNAVGGIIEQAPSGNYCARRYSLDSKGVISIEVLSKKPYIAFNRKDAVKKSKNWGIVSARVAELENSIGEMKKAIVAEYQARLDAIEVGLIVTWADIEKQANKDKKSFVAALENYNKLENEKFELLDLYYKGVDL